jgi:hypothetical protein
LRKSFSAGTTLSNESEELHRHREGAMAETVPEEITAAPRDPARTRALTVLVASAFFCISGFLPWMRASLAVPGSRTITAPATAFVNVFGRLAWLAMAVVAVAALVQLAHGTRPATRTTMVACSAVGVVATVAYLAKRTAPKLPGSLGGPGIKVWPTVPLFAALIAAVIALACACRVDPLTAPAAAEHDDATSDPEAAAA